jgi:hypothetical protein
VTDPEVAALAAAYGALAPLSHDERARVLVWLSDRLAWEQIHHWVPCPLMAKGPAPQQGATRCNTR